MRSLHTTKRPSRMLIISVGIIVVIAAIFFTLILQNRTASVGMITQLLNTDSIAEKPSVVGTLTSQSTANLAVVAPVTGENTGLAVRQTAAAQSQPVVSKVAYPSMQIGAVQRDRLFIIASSVALIGISLYSMTLLGLATRTAPVSRRPLYKVIDT